MHTVLIIDDDPDYRKLMGDLLKGRGWQVLEAESGDAGIELANGHRPNVVLSDLLMASGNGFQVCRALRSNDELRNTKIVVVSGRHFEKDRQAAFKAGADEYVTKPIDPDRLVLLLSRIAARAGSVEEPPAPVGSLSRGPTRVRFWGVRGSIATPGPTTVQYGGNTSCVEVRADGQIIILDAGTGMRLLGQRLVEEFESQPIDATLLLTHTHWDHIQGLPFFLPVYKPQNHLRILGFEGARHGLEVVLAGQMESPFFPIGLREVPANHPGICVGYRLFTSDGSIAFFPDNEPFPEGAPPLRAAAVGDEPAQAFARTENRKMIDFLRGTDVLIMDTQYDADEYKRHTGWGHGCLDDVVSLAIEAQVKTLFLFHHDPNHDDAKVSQMLAHARKLVTERGGKLKVEAAREGVAVELPALVKA